MHFGDRSETSNQVREILQTSSVKRGIAPRWVMKGVRKAIEEGRIPKHTVAIASGGTALDEATRLLGSSWSDHTGKFTWAGIEYLVSKPYWEVHVGRDRVPSLQTVCRENRSAVAHRTGEIHGSSRDGLLLLSQLRALSGTHRQDRDRAHKKGHKRIQKARMGARYGKKRRCCPSLGTHTFTPG
jgi:hypothetical protein